MPTEKTKTKLKRLLTERIKTKTIVWHTPFTQLALAPMSTTELIKTQLAQYVSKIQQWQMSLCQSSSTDMVARCSELWFCLQWWHWWKGITTLLGTGQ